MLSAAPVNRQLSLQPAPSAPNNLGTFNIQIVPGATLATNAPALAAFQRAANAWASYFSDPIAITVNADLAPMGSLTLGSTQAVNLQGSYATVRNQLVANSALETDDGIVGFLPTAAQFTATVPAGRALTGNMVLTKANAKAMGFGGLDADPAQGGFGASDGSITFNNQFSFDYDSSNGVSAGQIDFQAVATHEIGHLLGFTSGVDDVDVTTGSQMPWVSPSPLDLYRFRDGSANDPTTTSQFTTFARDLVPGAADMTDDLSSEYLMSTGAMTGDGRQASHWKDDALSGKLIGIMDPNLGYGQHRDIFYTDLRALDLIGYDFVPEPGCLALLALGGVLLLKRQRSIRPSSTSGT